MMIDGILFDKLTNEYERGDDYTHKIKWIPGCAYPKPMRDNVSDTVLACTKSGTYITVVYDYGRSTWCFANMKKIPHTVEVMQWFEIPEPVGGRYQDVDWSTI